MSNRRKIEELRKDLYALNQKIAELERAVTYPVGISPNDQSSITMSYGGTQYVNYFYTIPSVHYTVTERNVRDVLCLVIDHLGLELSVIPSQPQEVVLKPKDKKVKKGKNTEKEEKCL